MVEHAVDLGDHDDVRWLAFAVVAGCYSPTPPAGAPCSLDGQCPTGLQCSPASMTCELHAVDAPRSPDDAPAIQSDARAIDARPIDAPRVPWTLVQSGATSGSTISIQPTTAGDLIVVAVQVDGGATVTSITDSAGAGYTPASGARGTDDNDDVSIEIWYASGALAGATTITVTSTSTAAVVMWEVSGIRALLPLDAASALNSQAASTDVLGAPITTTQLGDFVVSVAIVANSVSAIHAGNAFTNDYKTKANGWAHLTSNAAPPGAYQAEWDQPMAGTYCAGAAAFFPSD